LHHDALQGQGLRDEGGRTGDAVRRRHPSEHGERRAPREMPDPRGGAGVLRPPQLRHARSVLPGRMERHTRERVGPPPGRHVLSMARGERDDKVLHRRPAPRDIQDRETGAYRIRASAVARPQRYP